MNPKTAVTAALMMVVCCAFIALSTFFAKVLGRGEIGAPMHPFEISFGRYVFALLMLILVAAVRGVRFSNAPLPLYIGRAMCGWGGVTCMFTAAAVIPLADATAISFLNPVFAMFLAIIFLKEVVGPVRWVAAAIALTGGVILIRPGGEAMRPEALIALLAACFMATEIIFAKLLARREPVLRLLLITNIIATILAACAAVWVWRAPSLMEWGVMAIVGLTMLVAQTLFMMTIQKTDASFATPFFYATLVFAALYDAVWFGEYPDSYSTIGAVLIVFGAVILAIREGRRRPSPTP